MDISVGIDTQWIEKLGKLLSRIGDKKDTEIQKVAEELLVIPRDLAPVFIEPNIQPYNSADDDLPEDSLFKTPIYRLISEFLRNHKQESDGRRQLFILGDAGMGKTSVLAMLKLAHTKSLIGRGYRCEVLRLGENSLAKIRSIPEKHETLLLLDSLDEDPVSFWNIKQRIKEILEETVDFYRVIITCRTQFFPTSEDDTFKRQDRINIGNFRCPVKYLSLFDDSQVNQYLKKRFPKDPHKIESAKQVLSRIHDLKFRPLVLTYIEDLIDEAKISGLFQIYEIVVRSWLSRECRKNHADIEAGALLNACCTIADHMAKTNQRKISERDLALLLLDQGLIRAFDHMDVGGRSLFNKNSDGNFVFSHISFQEFLIVKNYQIGNKHTWDYDNSTEVMNHFIRSADMTGVSLINGDFTHANLENSNMPNSNLWRTLFFCANLQNANLSASKFAESNFARSSLINANLSYCNLEHADFDESNLNNANLSYTRAISIKANNAIFTNANLEESNFEGALLINANFSNANLTNVNFKGAILRGANFKNANLDSTNFQNADTTNSIFDNKHNFQTTLPKNSPN